MLNCAEVCLDGSFVDEGAHECALGELVADADLGVGGCKSFDESVCDGFVDDEASCCGAALSCCSDRAEDDGAECEVEVCVFVDDDGVVSAEFEEAAAEALCDAL